MLEGRMKVPPCTSCGQSAAVLPQLSTGFLGNYRIVRDNEKSLQHCHSFQLPAGMAWGWSELPSWGRQSLLTLEPSGALVSSQLLQGSRASAASLGGAECLTDALEAAVSNWSWHICHSCAHLSPPCQSPEAAQSSLLSMGKARGKLCSRSSSEPSWHPAWCLAGEPSHHPVRGDVRKEQEITARAWAELWADELACIYPSCLSKQIAVLLVTRGICSERV